MTRPELPAAFLHSPIAHRALHDAAAGRPENSRAAVAAAVAAGYGIEVDVQLSADGAAMVFHDYDLDRMTAATGPVRAHRAADLATLVLAGGKAGIPRLGEILDEVDGRVPVLVEIKDQARHDGPGAGPLEHATAAALEGYRGPVAVMSFSPDSVAAMAECAPAVARGLVTCAFTEDQAPELGEDRRGPLRDIAAFDPVGASFVSHHEADLDRARVAALRAQGWPVLCWTIRSHDAEAAARRVACNITFEGYLPAHP